MPSPPDPSFMREAIARARDNLARGGRPFGAVLVRDGLRLAPSTERE